MSDRSNRALVVLAAYDYESLQVTLESLKHTIDPTEKVVVILNGKKTLTAERTERVARLWASQNPDYRFVVRPLCSGGTAYAAITEILKNYEPLQKVEHICKIDDDLIPVRKGWLTHLADVYAKLSKERSIGFITGLINNNCWGFAELVPLFNKEKEYAHMFNYTSIAGDVTERRVAAGQIDIGAGGTVWQYPYLAWWVHQWTSLDLASFIAKTNGLPLKQIAQDVHYSIGCIYFEKAFWLSMDPQQFGTTFDELLLHKYCQKESREKWAVMDEPMIHLFYRTQRQANQDTLRDLIPKLSSHFNDPVFQTIEPLTAEDRAVCIEEALASMKTQVSYLHKKAAAFSVVKNWKEKFRRKKLLSDM